MRHLFFVVFALCALFACKRAAKNGADAPKSNQLSADFNAFYEKFHADSLYQIAHISWPLAGETTVQLDSAKTQKQITAWLRSSWHMHKPVDFASGEFIRDIETMGDILVIETIRLAQTPSIGFERRFARQANGEWELIYYADAFEFSDGGAPEGPKSPIEVKSGN